MGGLGRPVAPVVGSPAHQSDPPGHAKPGCALENESPGARSAGGCQVVGAGPRPPELGRNWAQTQTEARGGWWGLPLVVLALFSFSETERTAARDRNRTFS
jgi:hypothetical protein